MPRSLRCHRWLAVSALVLLSCSTAVNAAAREPEPAASSLPALHEPEQAQAPEIYAARRAALMKEMGEGVAVIINNGTEDDAGHRPGSDFFYLTGVVDADAVLVLAPNERTYREFLFLANRDPEAERWLGERPAISDGLRTALGFEKVFRKDRLLEVLLNLAGRSPVLWQISEPVSTSKPADLELYAQVTARIPEVTVRTKGTTLARQRSVHSADELAIMQHAVRLSEAGFAAAAGRIRPGAFEGAFRAEAERVWRSAGSRRTAYSSIVGSGPNATILHYPRSERVMQDGELLLVDMAAEYAHYAADITRTFPVSGHFTAEQRAIYELVLKAQKTALAMVKPGVYMEDLDAAARKVIRDAGYGDAFIHGLGHFVGLDVHDAGDYAQPLAAGMVITIEPGIYIPEKRLGVRIEDDVLVTAQGARLLSDGLPREADEIEAWLARMAVARP